MQYSLIFSAIMATSSYGMVAALTDFTEDSSVEASSTETYIDSMCRPNITSPVPPCQAIINIEEQCQPNGTSSVDYIAHQECMCGGGFFSNWNGCQECQYVHGARSEAVLQAFESIISSVSVSLCTGTPTASFAAIFSSVSEAAPQQASGVATTVSDLYPSNAAVSLYYTASGPQGAGAITVTGAGAATTTATSVMSTTSSSLSSSGSHTASSSSSSGSSSTAAAGTTQSSSSSMKATTTKSSSGSSTATSSASSTSATSTGAGSKNKALDVLAIGFAAAGGFAALI